MCRGWTAGQRGAPFHRHSFIHCLLPNAHCISYCNLQVTSPLKGAGVWISSETAAVMLLLQITHLPHTWLKDHEFKNVTMDSKSLLICLCLVQSGSAFCWCCFFLSFPTGQASSEQFSGFFFKEDKVNVFNHIIQTTIALGGKKPTTETKNPVSHR